MLKILFLLFITLFSTLSFAGQKLQNGDVVLIALNCYSCPIIEAEEGGDYSHSGVILKQNGKDYVAQALGKVHLLPLEKFMKQARTNTKIAFLRPIEFLHQPPSDEAYQEVFQNEFLNKPFDSAYLWNNFDDEGNELFYCSEFVAKFLNFFLTQPLLARPMDFRDNWDFWMNVYNGNVPQGQPGNSPVSLFQDKKFQLIQILNK